jgi:2-keto-3-deoxy-galactonokinase
MSVSIQLLQASLQNSFVGWRTIIPSWNTTEVADSQFVSFLQGLLIKWDLLQVNVSNVWRKSSVVSGVEHVLAEYNKIFD